MIAPDSKEKRPLDPPHIYIIDTKDARKLLTGVHPNTQRLGQRRAAPPIPPPNPKAHIVAGIRDVVEEARVARDGDEEPRLPLPAGLIEDLEDYELEAVLELGAVLDAGAGGLERGLARARVEAVEPEHAGVHDGEEAQVVAAERQQREVRRRPRRVDERVDLAPLAAREHLRRRSPRAR